MGVEIPREKGLPWLVRLSYLLNRLPSRFSRSRFALLLDLEWTLSRLCHEASYRELPPDQHPSRGVTRSVLEAVVPGGSTVLDIGCGSGALLADLTSLTDRVVGVDRSVTVVAEARSRMHDGGHDNVTVEVADAMDVLSGREHSFDVVVLPHILEHLSDPRDLLDEVASSCRWLYVEVPNFEATATNLYRSALGRPLLFSDLDHVHEYDRAEMGAMLVDAGFVMRRMDHRLGMLRFWCEVQGGWPGPGE